MIGKTALAVAAVAFSITCAFADPVGRYSVAGSNPGNGGKYSGTVIVERTGETYRVTWSIAGQTYVGTGIGNDKGLAVAYSAAGQTGVAIYGANGDGWEGAWTYANGRSIGGEVWTRR